jgi:hypothetical protein
VARATEAVVQRELEAVMRALVLSEPVEPLPEGLALYRELARERMASAIGSLLEASVAHLGAEFAPYLVAFFAGPGPKSRYCRELAREFVEFCAPHWQQDAAVPDYLLELARHELLSLDVAAAPDEPPHPPAPLDLASGLRFAASCRLAHYRYAVAQAAEAPQDCTPPAFHPHTLFAFRDSAHEVRYFELSPAAAAFVENLLAGMPLGRALRSTAAAGESNTAACSALLLDLARLGAVVAPRPALSESFPSTRGDVTGA